MEAFACFSSVHGGDPAQVGVELVVVLLFSMVGRR